MNHSNLSEIELRKLRYVKCSPGGNTTVLVSTRVDRARHSAIARRIMALQPDVEQVGFVEDPVAPQARARLQMMGGEFCANATRSLAWVLWEQQGPRRTGEEGHFALEVSGVDPLLQVHISGRAVSVEMPINQARELVRRIGDKTIVSLEGISHVVVDRRPPPNARDEADRLLTELDLKGLDAAGVLYCQPYRDGFYITPIVWVRDTATLVEETACASGTISVALARAAAGGESLAGLRVYQPSGGVITASVEREGSAFLRAFIEGPVEILEEGELAVDASWWSGSNTRGAGPEPGRAGCRS